MQEVNCGRGVTKDALELNIVSTARRWIHNAQRRGWSGSDTLKLGQDCSLAEIEVETSAIDVKVVVVVVVVVVGVVVGVVIAKVGVIS